MKPLLGSLLELMTKTTFFVVNAGAHELCLNTGSLTLSFALTRFKGIIKAFSGMGVLTSIVFSNLVECLDFSDLSGATVGWYISFSE